MLKEPKTGRLFMTDLEALKADGKAPEFLTDEGYTTLCGGYLLPGETPADMYWRVAKAAAIRLNKPDLAQKFFDAMFKGWLCLATPVASNMGAKRGIPISCYSLTVGDSIDYIFSGVHELAIMAKHGGGVGICFSRVRCRDSDIANSNGKTEGTIPFLKAYDTTSCAVSQGSVRRGAAVAYLPIEHGDFDEFIRIRRVTGDQNRQCQNLHHAVTVTDAFMRKVQEGDIEARRRWLEVLKTRFETGEPYIMWIDTVNRGNPETYKKLGLTVETSNLCSEITGYTDLEHSFVCCLSSLNLAKYDEWKDTDVVETAIWFLDGVMEEFIDRASQIHGLEKAVRFAKKGRMLGLGVLGWHTLLQSKMLPFDSFEAFKLNSKIFKQLREQADKATMNLGAEYGEPEWCVGSGRRNTHCLAVAPTTSNATIVGNVSPSIEPCAANSFVKKQAKGTFIQHNQVLKKILASYGKDTSETWKDISNNEGSVQHLPFLSAIEKEVFLTAREINQLAIIKQAAARQKYIDQAQSVNLFFPVNVDPKFVHLVHMEGWLQGLKTLYYCRTGSVLKADVASRAFDTQTCASCEA